MSSKEMFGKIGIVLVSFLLVLFLLNSLSTGIWAETLSTVSRGTANKESLRLLWTVVVTATIIQAFVFYVALLGMNMLSNPLIKKNKQRDE
jgi:amino acid transporter